MRPSPARVAAPKLEVWLPIDDLGEVLELEVELWASELLDEGPGATRGASPSGNVTLLPAPVEPAPIRVEPEPRRERTREIAHEAAPAPAPAPPPVFLPGPAPATTTPATAPAPVLRPAPERVPQPRRETAPAPTRPRRRTHPQAPGRPGVGQAVVLTATVAAVAVGAMFLLGSKQHQVTVEVDGRSYTRSTDAGTVGGLLRDQHLVLGPHDVVAPGPGTHLRDGMVVEVLHDAVADAPRVTRPQGGAVPFGEATSAAATPPAPAPPAAVPVTLPAPPTPSTPSTVQHHRSPAYLTGNHHARGGASWYASPFGSDSCASRVLERGTIVSIVDLDNGRHATCRVADYGPVARSRVLDLDNDVFRRLSPLGIGVIPVAISW